MKDNVLVVEDDPALAKGLEIALALEGRKVRGCGRVEDARNMIKSDTYDIVVLDINLPDGSGLDMLKEIKGKSDSAVILLTANDMEKDIVMGLEMGADDYITKPFSLAVLRARINTQLRKKHEKYRRSKIFEFGIYRFDFERMEFFVKDRAVVLSMTEQKLLRLLTENAGIVIARKELVDRIWTDGAEYVDENALSVTVKRLRDKLEGTDRIRTVYGIGYMWVK